jgi:hypothetical protein
MKEDMLKDFISYAKEKYGVDITVLKDSETDSYEKIFEGGSLNAFTPYNYIVDNTKYEVKFVNGINECFDTVFNGDDYRKLEFAA